MYKKNPTRNSFEAGSLAERYQLNMEERDYQDQKPTVREKTANMLTNIYKSVFKPHPYEKIRLEESVKKLDPKTILEIGAGNDTTYKELIKDSNIKRYIRSDVSENQLHQIKDDSIENLVYDGIRHPIKDGSIDAIFSKCVFHHIDNGCKKGREKNRIDFLKEQKRLINYKGRVFCVDVYAPYKNGLKGALWHMIKHRIILGEEEHNFLTTNETIKLFKKAGFQDVKYEEVYTYKGKYFIVSGGKQNGNRSKSAD